MIVATDSSCASIYRRFNKYIINILNTPRQANCGDNVGERERERAMLRLQGREETIIIGTGDHEWAQ